MFIFRKKPFYNQQVPGCMDGCNNNKQLFIVVLSAVHKPEVML